MEKNVNKKQKENFIIKLITAILVLFSFLCIYIIVKNKNYSLISGTAGLIILIIAMNLANKIKFSKEKVKAISIISIVLTILSIPLIFKQVIFSFILVVPAFIFSKKAMQKDSRNVVTKIAFGLSSVLLIGYVIFSILSGFINVSTVSKL